MTNKKTQAAAVKVYPGDPDIDCELGGAQPHMSIRYSDIEKGGGRWMNDPLNLAWQDCLPRQLERRPLLSD